MGGFPITNDKREQIYQYAKDNPELPHKIIATRFGVGRSTVTGFLRDKEGLDPDRCRNTKPGFPITNDKREQIYQHVKDNPQLPHTITATQFGISRSLTKILHNQRCLDPDGYRNKRRIAEDKWEQIYQYAKDNPQLPHKTIAPLFGVTRTTVSRILRKNGIRRKSKTNVPDSTRNALSLTSSQPSSGISPHSPSALAHMSPSRLSANPSEDGKEDNSSTGNCLDFNTEPEGCKHSNSQSTTPLPSTFTDGGGLSLSGSAIELCIQFAFSLDSDVGAFMDQSRQLRGAASNFQQPRSQTSFTAAMSPNLPSQEDARRAAATLLSFVISHPHGFVYDELFAVVKLTERLRSGTAAAGGERDTVAIAHPPAAFCAGTGAGFTPGLIPASAEHGQDIYVEAQCTFLPEDACGDWASAIATGCI